MFHTTPYDPGPLGDGCLYVDDKTIKQITVATKEKSPFVKMMVGATLSCALITMVSALNASHDETIKLDVSEAKVLHTEKISGEELLNDELAMFKIATWIKSTYNVPTAFALETVRAVVTTSLSMSTDPYLMLAIAGVESNFNPSAKSNKGAEGLIQVRASVHGSVKDMTLSEQVQAGLNVLLEKRKMIGSDATESELLQLYNGIKKDKTQRYSEKVLQLKSVLKSVAESEFGAPSVEYSNPEINRIQPNTNAPMSLI